MIDKYYEFLLEKQLYDLILEGKMIFSTDFIEVLDTISVDSSDKQVADLASLIRHYSEKDVNIDTNCIDISDNPGMITFVPSDKVKDDELIYRILTRCDVLEYHVGGPHSLFKELDVPGEGLINLHPRSLIYDNWKLIKKETPTNYNLDFYYLQDINNKERFILVYVNRGAEAIVPNKSLAKKSDIKLGRFINKLLMTTGKTFTAATIEKFVNRFQSEILISKNAFNDFHVVEGDLIKHWYNIKNYEGTSGQLGNSCMRYENCRNFFNIYTKNPEVCKLLIFTPEKDKLSGRALLWTLSDGKKYMDRIYTNKDSHDNLFMKWAIENGYQKSINPRSVVQIKIDDYEEFPYMDTFQYYSPNDGRLSNNSIFSRPFAVLDETDGEADWKN